MNLGRQVGQASSLPVRAASLPPRCSAGKDARRTGSQDGCPTTARFMGRDVVCTEHELSLQPIAAFEAAVADEEFQSGCGMRPAALRGRKSRKQIYLGHNVTSPSVWAWTCRRNAPP